MVGGEMVEAAHHSAVGEGSVDGAAVVLEQLVGFSRADLRRYAQLYGLGLSGNRETLLQIIRTHLLDMRREPKV